VRIYTKAEVLKRLDKFTRKFINDQEAAAAIGCTKSQLSRAKRDLETISPRILEAIGLHKVTIYADDPLSEYVDGATRDGL
jgi:cell wall assembly regulator SMI1